MKTNDFQYLYRFSLCFVGFDALPLIFVGFSLIFVAFVGFVGFSISLAIGLDSTASSGLAAGQKNQQNQQKQHKSKEKQHKSKTGQQNQQNTMEINRNSK